MYYHFTFPVQSVLPLVLCLSGIDGKYGEENLLFLVNLQMLTIRDEIPERAIAGKVDKCKSSRAAKDKKIGVGNNAG